MKIYRIQNSHGEGPFRAHSVDDTFYAHRMDCAAMPSPIEDRAFHGFCQLKEKNRRSLRFGFPSKEALGFWVSESDMAHLKAHGFDVIEIEAEPVFISEHQVAFKAA